MSLYGGMTDTENITEDITKQTDALMTGRGTGGVRRDTAGNEKPDKTQEGSIFKIKQETGNRRT